MCAGAAGRRPIVVTRVYGGERDQAPGFVRVKEGRTCQQRTTNGVLRSARFERECGGCTRTGNGGSDGQTAGDGRPASGWMRNRMARRVRPRARAESSKGVKRVTCRARQVPRAASPALDTWEVQQVSRAASATLDRWEVHQSAKGRARHHW
eukprot:362917-Chlamydomonas_euryale.AAC.8